jgi:hypothetical protein
LDLEEVQVYSLENKWILTSLIVVTNIEIKILFEHNFSIAFSYLKIFLTFLILQLFISLDFQRLVRVVSHPDEPVHRRIQALKTLRSLLEEPSNHDFFMNLGEKLQSDLKYLLNDRY